VLEGIISLHTVSLSPQNNSGTERNVTAVAAKFTTHLWWDEGTGWKNLLNNLRLVLQPFVLFNLIQPWLMVFPIPQLSLGFSQLITLMNQFNGAVPIPPVMEEFLFFLPRVTEER
jgi:hypothetical protein